MHFTRIDHGGAYGHGLVFTRRAGGRHLTRVSAGGDEKAGGQGSTQGQPQNETAPSIWHAAQKIWDHGRDNAPLRSLMDFLPDFFPHGRITQTGRGLGAPTRGHPALVPTTSEAAALKLN